MDPNLTVIDRALVLEPAPAAWASSVLGLLDRAHAALPSSALAELLLAVRELLVPVAQEGIVTASPWPPSQRQLSPAAHAYWRPVEMVCRLATSESPRSLAPPHAAVAAWLDARLDDIASRPKGSAVPAR